VVELRGGARPSKGEGEYFIDARHRRATLHFAAFNGGDQAMKIPRIISVHVGAAICLWMVPLCAAGPVYEPIVGFRPTAISPGGSLFRHSMAASMESATIGSTK
jgi:hypothetical protein